VTWARLLQTELRWRRAVCKFVTHVEVEALTSSGLAAPAIASTPLSFQRSLSGVLHGVVV
jgi:hypothetical protein